MSSAEITKEVKNLKRRIGALERKIEKKPSVKGNIDVINKLFGLWKDHPVTAKEVREVRRRIWGTT